MANSRYTPPITPERAAELLQRIRPLVRNHGILYEIAMPALLDAHFTWKPVLKATADLATLRIQDSMFSYHESDDLGLCRPTIANVLAQLDKLPAEFIENVVAFEVRTLDMTRSSMERFMFTGQSLLTLLYAKA
jgi:hypothetical protein